jgi:GntR family transcriptional regulator
VLVRLDPKSPNPIYVQIADVIEGQIDAGALVPGERLPSARSLADSMGVNMHTVLKAYSHLESRGIVEVRRGRGGAVVSAAPVLRQMARRLTASARRQGVGKGELLRLVEDSW